MASHAIFQYNVLAIDDIHNTWTNMIVKMIILRLLGSSDDKGKIGVALRFRSTGRTDARASEHPVVVGRTDAMTLWCRRESKPSQPTGTG